MHFAPSDALPRPAAPDAPVLVVDDHPLTRALLQRLLGLDGFETIAAGTLGQAQRILEQTLPALIVLDLRLPDGDGLELAQRLKSDPATSAGAIIACSAGTASEDRSRAAQAGCDAYVSKPIDIWSFARLVAELTGHPSAARPGPPMTPARRPAAPRARSGASPPASARAGRP